jgi:hypothetical protein
VAAPLGRAAESDETSDLLRLTALPTLALFAWLALLGFFMPLDADEGVYRVVEVGIFDGRWPYRDLFTNRQPMTFAWYVPFGLGASVEVQRITAAAAMAASVPIVAVIAGRWLGSDRRAMAAAVYALLLANPFLQVQSNVEAYLLPLIAGAIAAPRAMLAGLLFGLALATKLHAIVFAPVLIVLWWRRELWAVALTAGAVCVLVSLPFVYIWRDYWAANVEFAFAYADYTADDRLQSLREVTWYVIIASLPLWIAGVIGLVLRRRDVALVVWTVCGVVSIKASGNDYEHYYALLMPPLALLATEGLRHAWPQRPWRLVLAPTIAAAVLLTILLTIALVREDDPRDYEQLADDVASKPGEVYMLGDRSQFYIAADRQPRRQYFFSIPLVMKEEWGDETRADLLACPPAVLVVPDTATFMVAWGDEIEQRYAVREDHSYGSVLTEPTPLTDDGQPRC